MKNDMILSLNEDTFAALKKDFDTILNRTIGNMEMKGASDAVITMKLSVSLDKRSLTVGDSTQEYNKPTFKHEISSVMQIKDKMTGQLGGDYAMVYDPDEECFVLRQFTGGQTSMFDDDYEDVDEEPLGQFADIPDDARSLPAPADDDEGDGTDECEDCDSDLPDNDESETTDEGESEDSDAPDDEEIEDDNGMDYDDPEEY